MNFLTEKSGEEKRNSIVVILVGAPGSGKSTFCEHVMRSSPRPWARICQVFLFIFSELFSTCLLKCFISDNRIASMDYNFLK